MSRLLYESDTALIIEDFQYPLGFSIEGRAQGKGWGGNWDCQGGGNQHGMLVINTNPLSFSSLPVKSTKYLSGGFAFAGTGRPISVTNPSILPYVSGGAVGADGTELWFSFLIRKDLSNDETCGILFSDTGIDWISPQDSNLAGIFLGYMDTPDFKPGGIRRIGFRDGGGTFVAATNFPSSIELVTGTSYFIVARVQFNSTSNIDVWINPILGGTPPVSPQISATSAQNIKFRSMSVYLGSSANKGSVARIEIGKTWKQVIS